MYPPSILVSCYYWTDAVTPAPYRGMRGRLPRVYWAGDGMIVSRMTVGQRTHTATAAADGPSRVCILCLYSDGWLVGERGYIK